MYLLPRINDHAAHRNAVATRFFLLRVALDFAFPAHFLPVRTHPVSAVWRYFEEWRHSGTLNAIYDPLRGEAVFAADYRQRGLDFPTKN